MMDDLYNEKIMEYSRNPVGMPRLDDPDGTAKRQSSLCGSAVEVDLKLDGTLITEFGYKVNACAMGTASAGIVAENIIGSTAAEMEYVRDITWNMIKFGRGKPVEKWKDLECLKPVKDHGTRHASTLLIFEAVLDAIEDASEQTS